MVFGYCSLFFDMVILRKGDSANVAGGFWAVILSRAAWKKNWAGCDPTRSIIPTDRSVAITGDMARAQLLTA